MKNFAKVFLTMTLGLSAVVLAATAFIKIAAPELPAFAAAAQTAAASNINQDQGGGPCTLAADGSSDISACGSWLWDHGYREKLWNWIWNAGLNFCVQHPGQPQKTNPPVIVNPTQPVCTNDCPPMGNPQDGSKTP